MMAIGSHQSARPQTDEWLTPPEILGALGDFDLDPSAPVSRPWPTAGAHFTIEHNGLLQRWAGRVWLNPPYSRAGSFMARLAEHGRGTALVFARTETEWWFRSIWPVASALLFLQGRLNFHLPNGRRSRHNAGAPSVLVAYGACDARVLSDCGLEGKFVPLTLPRGFLLLMPQTKQTWRGAVREIFRVAGGEALSLDRLYRSIATHPKTQGNRHWRAKVRQVVQQSGFRRVGPGLYELQEAGADA